jgi:hypothetical protein
MIKDFVKKVEEIVHYLLPKEIKVIVTIATLLLLAFQEAPH